MLYFKLLGLQPNPLSRSIYGSVLYLNRCLEAHSQAVPGSSGLSGLFVESRLGVAT